MFRLIQQYAQKYSYETALLQTCPQNMIFVVRQNSTQCKQQRH